MTRDNSHSSDVVVDIESNSMLDRSDSCDHSDLQAKPIVDLPPSTLLVILCISFYSTISLAIVYFNWWLFTSSFTFPVFVSWFQQIVGVVTFILFAGFGKIIPIFSHFPCVTVNTRTLLRVLPLSFNFVLMVAFANLCLKYVQVSTYQVARSLTIFFTIILSYGLLGQTQSKPVLASCGVMVGGFFIGSLDPSTLGFTGVVTGACSSVFQALYNVVIKRTLVHVDGDTNIMLFYNQIISSILFLPILFLSGEFNLLRTELPLTIHAPHFFKTWLSLIFSGLLAAFMNLAAYMCVKVTSPLTFNIVGFTKALIQSLGGLVFLGDVASAQSLGGILFSLLGSAWYSYIKVRESTVPKLVQDEINLETGVEACDGLKVVVSANPLLSVSGRTTEQLELVPRERYEMRNSLIKTPRPDGEELSEPHAPSRTKLG